MTDRAQAFIVILDDDYRIGDRFSYPSITEGNDKVTLPTDADFIAHAIRSIKGVISVEPVVTNYEDHIARRRVRFELREEMADILNNFTKKG